MKKILNPRAKFIADTINATNQPFFAFDFAIVMDSLTDADKKALMTLTMDYTLKGKKPKKGSKLYLHLELIEKKLKKCFQLKPMSNVPKIKPIGKIKSVVLDNPGSKKFKEKIS